LHLNTFLFISFFGIESAGKVLLKMADIFERATNNKDAKMIRNFSDEFEKKYDFNKTEWVFNN